MAYKDPEREATYQQAYREAHREKRLAQRRAYYEVAAHKEEHRVNSCLWREGHPEESRTRSAASRMAHLEETRARDRAYREAHREQVNATVRIWREAHREEDRAASRAWAKTHPQEITERNRRKRALKRGATVGLIDLEAIKIRDRMLCCICGKKVDERLKFPHPNSLSFDHSHPLGLLGPHSQENLRVAHWLCNSRRSIGYLPVQMVLC